MHTPPNTCRRKKNKSSHQSENKADCVVALHNAKVANNNKFELCSAYKKELIAQGPKLKYNAP